MNWKLMTTTALALSLGAGMTQADSLKIGVLATLEGPFTVLGEDGVRGVEQAVAGMGGMVAGDEIELIVQSTDTTPDSAIRGARKLIEQDGVQVIVGPLSGSEGIAIRDFSKDYPNVTFLNGVSGAQDTTLRESSENFFRFNTEGAQWMAGLADYIYNDKGYRSLAVVAEDYSFPYTQVFGMLEPFCRLGGEADVENRFWVPIGNKDYSSVIAALPDEVDAIYVALGGADAVNFLTQYQQAGGELPLVGGSITVDQTVLGSEGRVRDAVIGTPSAGPISDSYDGEAWLEFVADYKAMHDDGFPSPSLFAHGYYVNTLALLTGLDAVGGDLSDGGAALRATLSSLELETPTGTVTLDERRQAIADIFVTEVAVGPDGNLINQTVSVTEGVSQTLGQDYESFLEYGVVSRENPPC
ncbi:MAG: ABC transporter substrate-binding protein [Pseudomonadota bacterium]